MIFFSAFLQMLVWTGFSWWAAKYTLFKFYTSIITYDLVIAELRLFRLVIRSVPEYQSQ